MKRIVLLLLTLFVFLEMTACNDSQKRTLPESTSQESQSTQRGDEEEFTIVNETVTALSNVNIRSRCSSTSDSIGVLLKGESILRTGFSEEWSKVEFQGKTCYIASEYLSSKETGEENPSTAGSEVSAQESSTSAETKNEVSQSGASGSGAPAVETNPVDVSNLAALDNTPIPWGYASDQRDEFNRPLGVITYQKAYGGYSADFLKGNSNTIYLTFDEGYEFGCTPEILDTLKEKGVKAVFFITMPYAKSQPDLVRRMIDEGHVVGSHSNTHPADGMPSLGMQGVIDDISSLHQYVLDNFGYEMYLFRHPAGIFSAQTLGICQSLGYRSVFWSFAHKDWLTDDQPDPSVALKRCMDQLHPGAIYLLHAVSTANTQMLPDFIDQAQAAGYTFGLYAR